MAHDGQARDTTWAELDPYYTSDEEKNALLIEKRCLAYLPHTAKLVDNPAKRLVKGKKNKSGGGGGWRENWGFLR